MSSVGADVPRGTMDEWAGLPSSRAAMLAAGRSWYFTGKSCKRGHVSPRNGSGACVTCVNERQVQRRAENPEHVKAVNEASRQRHLDRDKERKRRYREANLERHKEWDRRRYIEKREQIYDAARKWKEANPDKIRAYARKLYHSKPERHLQKSRAWHERNPERSRQLKQKWRQANPERLSYHAAKRRALVAGAEGTFKVTDVVRLVATQKGRCACCGVKGKLTVDHIIPLSKGGTNWPSNLQMLCKSCNSKKHDIDPIVFMQRMGYLL